MTQASTEVEPWASLAERVASLLRVAPAERASSFLTVVQRAANELEVSLAPASRGDETALAAGSLVEVDSSLDSLPNELLHRIVVMACAGFGNRAAWQMVGAIASVCLARQPPRCTDSVSSCAGAIPTGRCHKAGLFRGWHRQ